MDIFRKYFLVDILCPCADVDNSDTPCAGIEIR
jgi:hypothetical protein